MTRLSGDVLVGGEEIEERKQWRITESVLSRNDAICDGSTDVLSMDWDIWVMTFHQAWGNIAQLFLTMKG